MLDLLAEAGDDGAVGAEDVAEAGGDEACLADLGAALDGKSETLHVDLGHALGAAHDIGGVDGFVGRHHHHLVDTVLHAFVSHLT